MTDNGLLSCFDAETGKPHYQQQRFLQPYNFKASPVGANGKLYLATEEGDVVVVRMGSRFEVLATNTMENQSFIASPVIVDGTIYLRSRTHLFAIDKGGKGWLHGVYPRQRLDALPSRLTGKPDVCPQGTHRHRLQCAWSAQTGSDDHPSAANANQVPNGQPRSRIARASPALSSSFAAVFPGRCSRGS